MRIRWERILGLISLGAFIYLSVRMRSFVSHVFNVVNTDYDYQNPLKSIMFGVLCLTLIVAIKLLIRK